MIQSHAEYLEKIKTALSQVIKIDGKEISAGTNLMQDLALESIDVVDFLFELERQFGVKLDFVQVLREQKRDGNQRYADINIGDLIHYLEKAAGKE